MRRLAAKVLTNHGFWIAAAGALLAGYAAIQAGSNDAVTATEAFLMTLSGVALTTWGSVVLSRNGALSPTHARSVTRQAVTTGRAVQAAREMLAGLDVPPETPTEVQVALARLDGALSTAGIQLTNIVGDLRDVQPEAVADALDQEQGVEAS